VINWNSYQIYDPGVSGPAYTLPRAEARGAFKRLMAAKPARIEMLCQLLKANGMELSTSDDGLLELNVWFFANVEPDPEKPGRLLPGRYSVVNDIGLFLGEVMIERCPGLHWEFFIWGKTDIAYHEAVIMGFSQVPDQKFNVVLAQTIARFAHNVVAIRGSVAIAGKVTVRGVEIDIDAAHASITDRQIENGLFLRWVKIAESRA